MESMIFATEYWLEGVEAQYAVSRFQEIVGCITVEK